LDGKRDLSPLGESDHVSCSQWRGSLLMVIWHYGNEEYFSPFWVATWHSRNWVFSTFLKGHVSCSHWRCFLVTLWHSKNEKYFSTSWVTTWRSRNEEYFSTFLSDTHTPPIGDDSCLGFQASQVRVFRVLHLQIWRHLSLLIEVSPPL